MEENSMKDKKRFVCANAFYEGREYYYCLKKSQVITGRCCFLCQQIMWRRIPWTW